MMKDREILEKGSFWCPAERINPEAPLAFEELLNLSRSVFDPKSMIKIESAEPERE